MWNFYSENATTITGVTTVYASIISFGFMIKMEFNYSMLKAPVNLPLHF